MGIKALLITAGKALLLTVAAILLWGSLVAVMRKIPSSPEGAMRGMWNRVAGGSTAGLPPRQFLDTYRHQLQTDYLLLPAVAGLLLGLLAAVTGWLRRRDQLVGGILFGAAIVSFAGPRSPYGWGAAALFTACLLAGASLRRRQPAVSGDGGGTRR